MTFAGEDIKAPFIVPNKAAVAEHIVTLPMAFAFVAFLCGSLAAAGFWEPDSPWFRLLMGFSVGLPPLATQLGQMWHSRNIRDKVATANANANGAPTTDGAP